LVLLVLLVLLAGVLGCVPSESGTLQLPAAGTGTLHLPSGSVPHLGAARASVTGVCAAGQAQAARLEPGGASAACPGQLGRRLVAGSSCKGPDGRTVARAGRSGARWPGHSRASHRDGATGSGLVYCTRRVYTRPRLGVSWPRILVEERELNLRTKPRCHWQWQSATEWHSVTL
jgi:hypothetical protein